MPRAAAARQEALLRLIAADPSLAKSVDTETLEELSRSNAQSGSTTRSGGCAGRRALPKSSQKVMLYSDSDAGQETGPKTGPSTSVGKSRQLRERKASRATPVVLLDTHVLSRVARSDTNQETSGVRRFDSASSMASSASSSSASSLPSPSTRYVSDQNSSQEGHSMAIQGIEASSLSPNKPTLSRLVDKTLVQSPQIERGSSEDSECDSSSAELTSSMSMSEASTDNPSIPASRIVLDHRCFVDRSQWVPHRARKSCFVCQREFSVLRKRHSCRMCGEVICSRCSVFKRVDLPIVDTKQRVCSSCFVTYRRKLDGENEHPSANNNQDAAFQEIREKCETSKKSSLSSPAYVLIDSDMLASVYNSDAKNDLDPGLETRVPPKPLSPPGSRSYKTSLSDTTLSSNTSVSSLISDWTWTDSSCSIIDPSCLTRGADEELEAVIRAKQLEQEVEASQERIRLLEAQIADQENQKDLLSLEQQTQLIEARATIQLLQEQLRRQEHVAREAAHTRDSICLQNLQKIRMTELHADADSNQEDDRAALRKRLKVLERQLQQAGISVAEVIPYEVATQKVTDISRRLQELSGSQPAPDNKLAQAAFKKEYFLLEQEMEKYHTALMLTDEYIEEQRRKEREWEVANCEPNKNAAKLLWSAIPVDISQLSERDLVQRPTPNGAAFPSELAKRLKRTNVLQLLRVDPKIITKMHPSVIEAYRTTGLTLVERRALHHVMQEPFREWCSQKQADEMARRKYGWYNKLKDALALAIDALDKHLGSNQTIPSGSHSCDLGSMCPVLSDRKSRGLYDCGLGFPSEPRYFESQIIKGDPDGAGSKAKKEAKLYASNLSVITQKRRREFQIHYGSRGVREIALALGALEESDEMLDRLQHLDAAFPAAKAAASPTDCAVIPACDSLISVIRELLIVLAKRANISLTGKRDLGIATPDTRSAIEVASSVSCADFCRLVLIDIAELFDKNGSPWPVSLHPRFRSATNLLDDILAKNEEAQLRLETAGATGLKSNDRANRVKWSERLATSTTETEPAQIYVEQMLRPPLPPIPATSSALFDAIRTRRRNAKSENPIHTTKCQEELHTTSSSIDTSQADPNSRPSDLLAAIRARKSNRSSELGG